MKKHITKLTTIIFFILFLTIFSLTLYSEETKLSNTLIMTEKYKNKEGINEIKELLKTGINSSLKYTTTKKTSQNESIVIYFSGTTPLMIASLYGYDDLVLALINDNANINAKNSNLESALILAVKNKKAKTVQILLNNSADTKIKDNANYSALMWAARLGEYESAKLLTEKGVTQEDKNEALKISAFFKNRNITKLLIEAGADINKEPKVLLNAAVTGDTEIVKLLIKLNADINYQNENGYSALMYAVIFSKTDVVKLLVNADADTKLKNNEGQTATDIAKENGFNNIVKILESKN